MKNTKFCQVFVETKLEFCKVIVTLEKKSGDHRQPEMNWHHEEVPLLHIQKAKAVPVFKFVLHFKTVSLFSIMPRPMFWSFSRRPFLTTCAHCCLVSVRFCH